MAALWCRLSAISKSVASVECIPRACVPHKRRIFASIFRNIFNRAGTRWSPSRPSATATCMRCWLRASQRLSRGSRRAHRPVRPAMAAGGTGRTGSFSATTKSSNASGSSSGSACARHACPVSMIWRGASNGRTRQRLRTGQWPRILHVVRLRFADSLRKGIAISLNVKESRKPVGTARNAYRTRSRPSRWHRESASQRRRTRRDPPPCSDRRKPPSCSSETGRASGSSATRRMRSENTDEELADSDEHQRVGRLASVKAKYSGTVTKTRYEMMYSARFRICRSNVRNGREQRYSAGRNR